MREDRTLSPWTVALAMAALVATAETAEADVFLNEIWMHGDTQVEVYNSGPGPVNLKNWRIDAKVTYTIDQDLWVAPGGYAVIPTLAPIFENLGGIVGLIDEIERVHDEVKYGIAGGAPSPPPPVVGNPSLARTPDASNQPAPPQSPVLDAYFWTVDLSSTVGAANDVPNPALGYAICINEMLASFGGSLADSLEFCGPSSFMGSDTKLDHGWYITTAFGVQFLSGIVPAGGFLGIQLNDELFLKEALRVDLFNPEHERVFQKSLWGADLSLENFGDCPDGAGPPDGWDYATSGGGVVFIPLEPTYGASNATAGLCDPDGGPVDPPVDPPHDPDREPDDTRGGKYDHTEHEPDKEEGVGEHQSRSAAQSPAGQVRKKSWGEVKRLYR